MTNLYRYWGFQKGNMVSIPYISSFKRTFISVDQQTLYWTLYVSIQRGFEKGVCFKWRTSGREMPECFAFLEMDPSSVNDLRLVLIRYIMRMKANIKVWLEQTSQLQKGDLPWNISSLKYWRYSHQFWVSRLHYKKAVIHWITEKSVTVETYDNAIALPNFTLLFSTSGLILLNDFDLLLNY